MIFLLFYFEYKTNWHAPAPDSSCFLTEVRPQKQLLRLYALLSGWKVDFQVNFKNSAKDAIASLMNSPWTEKAPYAAMTHTDTQSSSYLHECAHTAATLDKLVRNWASGESLTLSVQLGPPDRSYTLNSVDSKESNLWLSQSGLIRSEANLLFQMISSLTKGS